MKNIVGIWCRRRHLHRIIFLMRKNIIGVREEFVIIKNHHEPIISREMFEKAEKIFSRNKAQKDSENT